MKLILGLDAGTSSTKADGYDGGWETLYHAHAHGADEQP